VQAVVQFKTITQGAAMITCHFATADLDGGNVTPFGVPFTASFGNDNPERLSGAVPLVANVSLVAGTYDLRVYCDNTGFNGQATTLGGSLTAGAYPA